MIKIRFNLSRGKNYKKWKIDYGEKNIQYISSNDFSIIMKNCLLKNNKKLADKIFNGANKDVCAFIICEEIEIISNEINYLVENNTQIIFNPKIKPYWNFNGINYDNKTIDELYTINNKVFIKE